MRSSSSELISVYRAPNLHIDNAKMSKVTAPRLRKYVCVRWLKERCVVYQ